MSIIESTASSIRDIKESLGIVTIYDFANILNGRQYGKEITKEECEFAKFENTIIVFGASDDLMEFRGAIDDEVDCYGGGNAYLTKSGLLNLPSGECADISCPYFKAAMQTACEIKALWCNGDEYSWTYEIKSGIPFAEFDVMDGEKKYCKGIVFNSYYLP